MAQIGLGMASSGGRGSTSKTKPPILSTFRNARNTGRLSQGIVNLELEGSCCTHSWTIADAHHC